MIAPKVICLLLSASVATAFPTLAKRAGGPTQKPIPDSCTISSVTPATARDTTSFQLTSEFQNANQVYAYYLQPEQIQDEQASLQQCLEQCYGYGSGECTSVLWAHNVHYTSYGAQNTGTACLFMSNDISGEDLVPVTDGSHTNAQALVRSCP